MQFFAERARKKKEQYEKKLRYEIGRRINPRSGADFEILYQELETWRLQVTLFLYCFHHNEAS
jgi:hypothetical protein